MCLVGIVGERRVKPKVDPALVSKVRVIEDKWVDRWVKSGIFEAEPDPSKPKFFVTFPYPYINGLIHLGGAFTILRVDITARYK
ncbi:MAG: class I tRNA ligase family protein, partial [archaeon YNP-LCB-003-016]|nr:class I tRNA ligase family protein [Candidatus Culexarchaeum yellowstonense]